MRTAIKSVSAKAQKFIPKAHADLKEDAKDIKDRPMVIMGRPLTREDRFNLQSLIETKGTGENRTVSNLGTLSKYIWENCATEVRNVVAEEGDFEVMKGDDKNRLFNAQGMEEEVGEFVAWVQTISRMSEEEAKN